MRLNAVLLLICLIPVCQSIAASAEWQWSVEVPAPQERPTESSRAFLWIPPHCSYVRGVVFGHHNMQEEPIFEHERFRAALAELNFAVVWVAPKFDQNFRFDQDAGERFDRMLKALAERSGYSEIEIVPIVPVGHSAAASIPWYMAAWKPERILAGISTSGQWPYVPDEKGAPHVKGVSIDSVPGLVLLGEYEWADTRMRDGIRIRGEHPAMPLSGLGCPADGHFHLTDEKVDFIALYLKKAAKYRIPARWVPNQPVPLVPIDAKNTGWLVERYRYGKDPATPTAPASSFSGNVSDTFWFFDEEIAQAAEAFQKRHRGKPALLGYVQDGTLLPETKGAHHQVSLAFKPDADGITFRLNSAFRDSVPEGRPERWVGKKAGERIEPPPSGGPPIEIKRITGPVRRIAPDTWEVALNRTSLLGDRRGNEAWFAAEWPGDGEHKRAIQQAMMSIPRRLNAGAPQKLSFDLPESVTYGPRDIKLTGYSDAGLPVRYFVREGGAEIDGTTLRLLRLPPRTKFPTTVTVIAWQLGTSTEPKIQSAEPIVRTLTITR